MVHELYEGKRLYLDRYIVLSKWLYGQCLQTSVLCSFGSVHGLVLMSFAG